MNGRAFSDQSLRCFFGNIRKRKEGLENEGVHDLDTDSTSPLLTRHWVILFAHQKKTSGDLFCKTCGIPGYMLYLIKPHILMIIYSAI